MGKRIFVYLQHRGVEISRQSLMALGVASRWARELGASLEGVWLGGEAPESVPGELLRVHKVEGEGLHETSGTWTYARALDAILREEKPTAMVFPGSTEGEELASWVGAQVGGALIGVNALEEGDGEILARRTEFDSKVLVEYSLGDPPVVVSVERGFGEEPGGPSRQVETISHLLGPFEGSSRVKVVKRDTRAAEVDLRKARAIVAVGAGVRSPEVLDKIKELATLLGAEIGGTRAAVDAGWVGHDRQIGQTGARVKPDLYLACGISGAVQHRVGMMESGTIVSINIDPAAPIFKYSHFSVVGDLREVVPKLLKLLRR